jgi:hypothetical protein
MALPSSNDLLTMDYGLNGQPAVLVPTTNNVNTFTMDYGLNGQPFVTNPATVSGPAHLKTWFGVAVANIKTINGVAIGNVKTLDGIA